MTNSTPDLNEAPSQLVVIGGSHSVIWGGGLFGEGGRSESQNKFEGVDVRHLGSGLAYHLLDKSGEGLGKNGIRVFQNLKSSALGVVAAVMLCFGEADIRTEVVEQAHREAIGIEESSKKVAKRLLKFSELLHDEIDKPIFIWEPPPTADVFFPRYSDKYPYVGHTEERNFATLKFSEALREGKESLMDKAIYPFGILPTLMNRALRSNPEFYVDGCHLNHLGMEHAINAFEATARINGCDFPNFFHSGIINAFPADRKVTDIKIRLMSTTLAGEDSYITPNPSKPYIFSTELQHQPFVLLQMGYSSFVTRIEIFNRRDGHQGRAKHLNVAIGNNPSDLRLIHTQNATWGINHEPLVINLHDVSPFTFIGLYLTDTNYLQLAEVNIYETSFLNSA
ncbi:MAG: hypothetical protein RLY82_631 [Pseudomonadota bacterium]|jgi:hypothetical protein